MIFDFSFDEVMRLSSVKRWGIIEMSRTQSVAEHSYNVAVITTGIVNALELDSKEVEFDEATRDYIRSTTVQWALAHDLPELVSGDIPTPMKTYLGKAVHEMEQTMFPELTAYERGMDDLCRSIVKIADFMDAIQFAEKFCIDSRKDDIVREMRGKLEDLVVNTQLKNDVRVASAVEHVWFDVKTRSKRPY